MIIIIYSLPAILVVIMSIKSLVLPPSLSLAGKSAIVTGSSRGIGRGIALLLTQSGAAVAITYTSDNSTAKVESLAAESNNLTRACVIKANLADLDCGPKIIQGALRGLGVDKMDVLVNNAAVGPPPFPATAFDAQNYEVSMNINVRAPMLLLKELLPVLSEKDGRVINMCVCANVAIERRRPILLSLFSEEKL
jgi:3-oxoacyl-[acyl-carrier protein] reductase